MIKHHKKDGIESEVKYMSDLQIINQCTNQNRKTKQVGSNISQVVENDIWVEVKVPAEINESGKDLWLAKAEYP